MRGPPESGPTFQLRREPPRDPDEVGEDEELVRRIRDEIVTSGPMTFARFMELALYEPGHGYYRRLDPGPGATGDFLTAPEAHPIFGETIGRLLEETWHALDEPAPFVVTEHGAGTGALAAAILGGLRRSRSALAEAIRYRPVDIEPARIDEIGRRLGEAGLDRVLITDAPEPGETGAIVANEVLDALPVHRVVMRKALRELFVVVTPHGFAEEEGDPSIDRLTAHLTADGVALAAGRITEIPLEAERWIGEAAAPLARGIVLLIDYGAEPADLHGPARPEGSLRAFARHSVVRDPFTHIGRQDLTTHVCLEAVRRRARQAGLDALGETTQAEFLAAGGADDLVRQRLAAPGATLEDALAIRSALARLLDPRVMGDYHVLAFGRGLPDDFKPAALTRLGRR